MLVYALQGGNEPIEVFIYRNITTLEGAESAIIDLGELLQQLPAMEKSQFWMSTWRLVKPMLLRTIRLYSFLRFMFIFVT
jgi:hypothetical protein